MEQYSLSFMRESCDKYQDGRGCPAWVTQFNVDKNERCWDAAKLALNIYNQEEQKNFNLEKELDDIAILSDPVENNVEALSESKEDHSPYPRKRARIELDLGDDYVYSHYFVVSGGVNEGVMAGPDVA